MKRKFITEKQLLFIAYFLGIQNLAIVPIFVFTMYLGAISESARMQDMYVPSMGEKILQGAFILLVSPCALALMAMPSNWKFFFAGKFILMFALNVALTASFLFVACVLFNAWKSRNRGNKFASESEISVSARD